MKTTSTLLITAAIGLSLFSCSAPEMTVTDANAPVNRELAYDSFIGQRIGEALKESFKNIKIDFTRLFTYVNKQELVENSESKFKFALDDLAYELSLKETASDVLLFVEVKNGEARVKTVDFINSKSNTTIEKMVANISSSYDVTYNKKGTVLNSYKDLILLKKDIKPQDAHVLSDYLVQKVINSGKEASFVIKCSRDSASLYAKS